MRIDIFATSIGDVRFDQMIWASHIANTHLGLPECVIKFNFILDECVPVDQTNFISWVDPRDVIYDKRDRGVNAIWGRCVKLGEDADIVVVMNDDLWLTPGWLYMVQEVLMKNPKVALCGIACNDDAVRTRTPDYKDKWFDDRTIFRDVWRDIETPVKYEPWPSGVLWACKPKPWLEMGGIDLGLWLSYGEMDMARKLFERGWYTAGIYYPTIFHFGGGTSLMHALDGFKERVDKHAHNDRFRFEELYGTGHAHLLCDPWREDVLGTNPAPIVCDPKPVMALYADQ